MKKVNFKNCMIVLTIGLVMISCGGKSSIDEALSQMEKAMDRVEKNKTSMTEVDWKALNEELDGPAKVLNEALESDNVSGLKKLKISAVVLRYAAVAGEAAFHTVTDSLKTKMGDPAIADSVSKISNQLQEVLESDELKQAMQELQKVSEELQGIGK